MQPLAAFPLGPRSRVTGVFADIDETVTTAGRLTAEAYAALEALHEAGFLVVPVTGRPAGWCDHMARMWPVDAIVGENGAFYFRYDHETRVITKRYVLDAAPRAANRRRLDALAADIFARVPGAAYASDQVYRDADIAIDYCEDVDPLPESQIETIVAIATAAGAVAKVSSIHVNCWFGDTDKLAMTRIVMDECFGIDLDSDKERFVFIGDSPNDEPMFRFFPHAVGVANLARFAQRMEALPAYVTERPAGAGLAELAAALIAARTP